MARIWLVLVIACVGCGRGDSCKDAVQKAYKTMYGTSANRDRMTMLIGTCEQDEWSGRLRDCIAEVTDENGIARCHREDAKSRAGHQDKIHDAVDRMQEFQTEMCQCRDKACAERVNDALTKWGSEMAKHADKDERPDEAVVKRMTEIVTRYTECMTKLMTLEAGSGAGLGVTELSPAKGDAEGGTYVVIKGSEFLATGPRNAKVYFGSRQGTVVRFSSDRELIVQAPGGKPNETVDVLVIFEPGGERKLSRAFTFVDKSAP